MDMGIGLWCLQSTTTSPRSFEQAYRELIDDARLAESSYVASDRFTYADIVAYVYREFANRATGIDPVIGRDNLTRWSETIAIRPAVQAAMG